MFTMPRMALYLAGAVILVAQLTAQEVAPTEDPLIARTQLFGNPDRAAVQLSRDGKFLSWLAPVDGVMNIWVAPRGELRAARAVTKDTGRGIRQYSWAWNHRQIIYLQDKGGDENWRVYATDIETTKVLELTPMDGVAARIQGLSPNFPDEIVIGLNQRNPQLHDLFRVNLTTGEKTLLLENERWLGFVVDDDFTPRLATTFNAMGGVDVMKIGQDKKFEKWTTVPQEDSLTTSPYGYDNSGKTLYFADSRGRDTSALFAIDTVTGASTLVAEDPRADVGGSLVDPKTGKVQAVSFNYDRIVWKIVDPLIEPDLAYLKTVASGELTVASRTAADDFWVVGYLMDDGPVKIYLYDRAAKKAHFLFTNRSALEGLPLAPMHPTVLKSRDGLNLVSYLTLPRWTDPKRTGRPSKPLPMILLVHGGPWARDGWGYHPTHQWLANRGYAVLSVNFRGSTGLGKAFTNAGNREWAGKMHDDLLDAMDWAVAQKIADPKKVGIMGGSYGGYATLVGLTFTPETFACGVDIVGPSNLNTLLSTIPAYWKPAMSQFSTRVGDPATEDGKKFLDERSPLSHVEKIKRPLLIGQGKNDPRVKESEADQIVGAMQKKKIPVTYVLYPDEGHGFQRPENNKSFNAVTESFLSLHLGGRAEPVGNDFKNSSIQIPTGLEHIPSIADAVKKP